MPQLTHEELIAGIKDRLREGTEHATYAYIARRTRHNPETVRRQLVEGTPSTLLLCRICQAWNLNANWLLFGVEPRYEQDPLAQLSSWLADDDAADAFIELLQARRAAHLKAGHRRHRTPAPSVHAERPLGTTGLADYG